MEQLKTIIDLVTSLVWPGIIMWVLFYFRNQIKRLLDLLPSKLNQASKISVGSFSLEIEEKLKELGMSDLTETMHTLSREAYELIIKLGNTSSYYHLISQSWSNDGTSYFSLPSDKELKFYKEIEEKGIIEFSEPLDEIVEKFKKFKNCKKRSVPDPTWSILAVDLPEDAKEQFKNIMYNLTNKGKRIYDAMFDIIINEFCKDQTN